jgi:hypothetical protein
MDLCLLKTHKSWHTRSRLSESPAGGCPSTEPFLQGTVRDMVGDLSLKPSKCHLAAVCPQNSTAL